MNFLPDSEIINLKYQLAQQIKANINRAASSKNSNTPFLESCVDTLVDEIAELKIELSKLSLTLSSLQNGGNNYSSSSSNMQITSSDSSSKSQNGFLTFPIKLNPEYLQDIDNFYYPETGNDDSTFIWIGPENKASIELRVNITFPIKLIFKNVRFVTDAIRESLKIFINGEQLELELFKQNDGYTITAVWMPLHNSIKHKCTIDICVDKSISVQDIYPETSDTRKLCLALNEIEIHNNSLEYVNT